MIQAINTAQAAGGHVLWHCRTGFRTGAFPSALFAVINGEKADAVGARMAKLGYDYTGNLKNLIDDATATLECADCKCDGTAACTGTFKIKPVKIKMVVSVQSAQQAGYDAAAALKILGAFVVGDVTPACTSQADPICSGKSYICPSCYELHGVADCGDRAGKNPRSSIGLELPRTS